MNKKLTVVVMAGGLGKRMQSELPKVLHKVGFKPMLVHILESLRTLHKNYYPINKLIVVVGKFREIIKSTLEQYINISEIIFVDQLNPMGTGHALQCCLEELTNDPTFYHSNTLILSGDVPLIRPETLFNLIDEVEYLKIMVTKLANPVGYGRIIETYDESGVKIFNRIVEEKDCSPDEGMIKKVNCGIYVINTELLSSYLPHLNNNNSQKEYYLTDIIEIIKNNTDVKIEMYEIPKENQYEIMGVNTIEQLKELEINITT